MLPVRTSLTLAATLPVLASSIAIPSDSPFEGLTPRDESQAKPGTCYDKTYVPDERGGWCDAPDASNGCWDPVCTAYNWGDECSCTTLEPHWPTWGRTTGSFKSSKRDKDEENPKPIDKNIPRTIDENPLLAWCWDPTNKIPAQSVVAGTYKDTMFYVCNFLEEDMGCSYKNEALAALDEMTYLSETPTAPRWTFSEDWNKSYGLAKNGSYVCTNLVGREEDILYIGEDGEIQQ